MPTRVIPLQRPFAQPCSTAPGDYGEATVRRSDHIGRSLRTTMAAIDETGEHGSTKTFVNRTPAEDVRAGIPDGDHGDDRIAAGPACPTGSREGQLPVRELDMSRIGDAAASDRYSITALMTKKPDVRPRPGHPDPRAGRSGRHHTNSKETTRVDPAGSGAVRLCLRQVRRAGGRAGPGPPLLGR